MERQVINLTANEQSLVVVGGVREFATNTVSYIDAVFDLGDNWQGYDSISAVWQSNGIEIATVIGSDSMVTVPHEIVAQKGYVKVNLVGSISGDTVEERLTTYPVIALALTAEALVDGSETTPVTPSQFEQFVSTVKADATNAQASAESAQESAERAEQASAQAGYMFFYIDDNGDLIYQRTTNTEVDFYLDNGDLYVGAIA